MFEKEERIEQHHKIVDIVEKILSFSERFQEGQELKILTPNQILSRVQFRQLNKKQEIIQKTY